MTTLAMPSIYLEPTNQVTILGKFYRLIYRNPLYLYTLFGRTPKRLLGTPLELIPGNPTTGQSILAGKLIIDNEWWPLDNISEISNNRSPQWQAYLHGFSWLSDLRAVGNNRARYLAHKHVATWLNTYTRWSPLAWQADILGQRLTNWITHFGFFASDATKEFNDLFFQEITKQARHLNRSLIKTIAGPGRIRGLKGLIYCGISLPDFEVYKDNGLRLLESELKLQLYPDGGHYSRNPQIHLEVLADLISIRHTLKIAHIDAPSWLINAIKIMVPLLRTFRHADGGLAYFNGSSIGEPTMIDTLLFKSGVKTRAISSAPHSGFQRIVSGKTMMLIDTGSPPESKANKWGHAGALAFEMSSGKDRIIVNCGMPKNPTKEWQKALRSTAAHSTITVNNTNSSEIDLRGGFISKTGQVTSSRREIGGSTIIEASYDGYSNLFGLIHRRLIMLAPDGRKIQGEDNLIGSSDHNFNLRFHLHPNVQVANLQNKYSVILKTSRGTGWKFTCVDQVIVLEESIYFDNNNKGRKTKQIHISGSLGKTGAIIKWRLSKI